jgi:NAD(P)H-hydrate epimerase
MKFFATQLIRDLDQMTIEHEPIASIDLMERAAEALSWKFIESFPYLQPVCIFAGLGNNGGDALALARKLLNSGYTVSVILIRPTKLSADCETNRQRLLAAFPNSLTELQDKFIAPKVTHETIIVDGLFGSGLSRPMTGIFAEAVEWMNRSGCEVVAIDIPSGLQGENSLLGENPVIVKAAMTMSLQFPKLAFFFPENAPYVGDLEILDIGIHPEAIKQTSSDLYYLEETDIEPLLRKRAKFSHKGTFGHALIVAGSQGMAGASVLSAKAALRSGAGLVTVHGPECNRLIVQTAIPEAIFQSDLVSETKSTQTYNAVAIGPGLGTQTETTKMLRNLLTKMNKPCVLDADALNIISQHRDLLPLIPKYSILTPHPKEFDRLFGVSTSSYARMMKAQENANLYGLLIVLKGANTLIAAPDTRLYFNSTGNSGMATAGSGDVLTGILVGLLAQGYSSEDAAKIGVFLHGRAGDLVLETESKESLVSGDIIDRLGKAYKSIRE